MADFRRRCWTDRSFLTTGFDLADQRGSDPMKTTVTREDTGGATSTGGVRMRFRVGALVNQGDIAACRFDPGGDGSVGSTLWSEAGPLPDFETDMRNVQAGTIGARYDFGVTIGAVG
ncbi:hypothetical protein CCR90_07640 [Rhodovulum sulfidophilum]|uniref:hypothetical protein n=1 Tax=Rhodovulum sulfidophilum TaxID=35806 RepID=UPI001913F733|nr:hypothetical protein [Rhodovulum sulfidophilum]MBK5923659.1 hypothetical protein [Rhodovulum sulfidophilum]